MDDSKNQQISLDTWINFLYLLACLLYEIILVFYFSMMFINKENLVCKAPCIQGFSKCLPYFDKPIAFATVWIGYKQLKNQDRIRKNIVALQQTMPGAKLTIITNCYTEVDPSILTDYNLWITIDYTSINVTREEVNRLYPFHSNFWTWFGVYRYKFYVDYLEKHSEYENMLFMDVDTLILKNPLDILYQENKNYIHMMYDYYTFRKKDDGNYIWFKNFYEFMQTSNRSKVCNVPKPQYHYDSETFLNLLPINAGLMFGKTTEILKLCRLLTNASLCINMFKGSCEQALINYLYYNGMINKTGIVIRAHHMNDSKIISCPEWFTESELKQSDNWYILHHFYKTSGKNGINQRLRDINNIKP